MLTNEKWCAIILVSDPLKADKKGSEQSERFQAEKLGVGNKTLGSWENYQSFPGADMIPKICELYGLSYDHINFLPKNPLKAD